MKNMKLGRHGFIGTVAGIAVGGKDWLEGRDHHLSGEYAG
jgi:hypothetical protein